MADASGDRPWYEELAPDLEGDAGRGVEGSRVDSRRRVMAVWRGFEDSRAGVWLAEHTRLLAALSREGSVLVRRLAAGVLLVAMFVIFMKFNFFAIMKYENFIREHGEDQVTGAASLSRFLEVAPGAINRSRERGVEVAIFYTDLPNFRDVNIAHGYDVGTDILREIYRILTEQFPTSVITRISGTHFAGEVPLSKAQAGFERVAQRCEALSIDETLRLRVGIYPLSYLGDDEDSKVVPEEMMHLVDLAATAMRFLAPASQEHVRFYDGELERNERIRLHVLASLDKAIEKDWLRIYYQPIVEVSTRKVAEYEALSRWVDPEFGFLTPDQFVVPLETARMTCKMDLNILRLFGRDVKRLRKENRAVFPISFNISRTDLESGIDLFGAIEEAMRQADLPRELVHVEITESALNGSSTAMAAASTSWASRSGWTTSGPGTPRSTC